MFISGNKVLFFQLRGIPYKPFNPAELLHIRQLIVEGDLEDIHFFQQNYL